MKRDVSGPAFPRPGYHPNTEGVDREDFNRVLATATEPADGMTLREWYAGLALQGLLASHTGQTPLPPAKGAAQQAVEFADALLEELRT